VTRENRPFFFLGLTLASAVADEGTLTVVALVRIAPRPQGRDWEASSKRGALDVTYMQRPSMSRSPLFITDADILPGIRRAHFGDQQRQEKFFQVHLRRR
jgi:hypothetical protein